MISEQALIQLIHYSVIAFCTLATALGASLGQGATTQSAIDAINRQPAAQPPIARTNLLALALIETSAILGFLMSILIFYRTPVTLAAAIAEIGMGIATAIPGLATGWATSKPARSALLSTARQPFLSREISNFMMLVQSLLQTPYIFGFIITLVIQSLLPSITMMSQGFTLLGAGIAIGLGSIGPAFGGGHFAQTACQAVGINRAAYKKLFTFTFISQALIETPVIFATIIALFLTTRALSVGEEPFFGLALMTFGATIGVGTFGAGISSGRTAAAAILQIAQNPQSYNTIARASMMAQGLMDTCAVYAFIIALWLVFTPLV